MDIHTFRMIKQQNNIRVVTNVVSIFPHHFHLFQIAIYLLIEHVHTLLISVQHAHTLHLLLVQLSNVTCNVSYLLLTTAKYQYLSLTTKLRNKYFIPIRYTLHRIY